MLRDDIKSAQVTAMKAREKDRTAALRMILAKVKDRDIELRPIVAENPDKAPNDDTLVIEVLQKMAKQRRESIQMFEDGGRADRAAEERAELSVIEEFLPRQMDEAETKAAIAGIKDDTGATSMKDMGSVMGELKKRHGAQLDMGRASGWVKEMLS